MCERGVTRQPQPPESASGATGVTTEVSAGVAESTADEESVAPESTAVSVAVSAPASCSTPESGDSFAHLPSMHAKSAAQCDLSVHDSRHFISRHVYGEQLLIAPALQVPVPSHVPAAVDIPAVHDELVHVFVAPGNTQASRFDPSHAPPHALFASPGQAARPPCGAPVTPTQVPRFPGKSQASHCPPQTLPQQRPSTQKFDLHSPTHDVATPAGHLA